MINLNSVRTTLRTPLSPLRRARTVLFNGKKRRVLVWACSAGEESKDEAVGGDRRRQEILAAIAMLQAEKVRAVNYLDDQAKNLNKFGESANAELEEIGKSMLSDLDETSDRIMERLDGRMEEFDRDAEIRRQEIEANEKILQDFERQIERGRNEGLFFKNLKDKKSEVKPEIKLAAMAEAEKIKEVTRQKVASKLRRNVYLALMSVLALTIGNAVLSAPGGEVEWRKVAALGLIFIGLVAQLVYEQDFSSDSEDHNK